MKWYKCIKEFTVDKCDDDGFLTNKQLKVKKSSKWNIPDDEGFRFIGGEVRLENENDNWIEIPNKDFSENFTEMEVEP